MTAGHQQRHVRERRRLRLQQGRQQVPFEVMHADGWLPPGVGEAAGERGTRQKRADQPGTRRCRRPRPGPTVGCQPSSSAVRTRGKRRRTWSREAKLGHDATEHPMQVDLAEQLMGQQAAPRGRARRRRFRRRKIRWPGHAWIGSRRNLRRSWLSLGCGLQRGSTRIAGPQNRGRSGVACGNACNSPLLSSQPFRS